MGFRDNDVAQNARKEAERIDRLEKERLARETEARRQKPVADTEPSYSYSPPYYRNNWTKPGLTILGGVGIFCLVGYAVYYHAEYALREGIVTDKDYQPAYTTTSCTTSNGRTTCSNTHHPPQWDVTVSYGGTTGTWDVSEQDYDFIRYGQWWCARDFGYVCRGPQAENVPADFYTLARQEEDRERN